MIAVQFQSAMLRISVCIFLFCVVPFKWIVAQEYSLRVFVTDSLKKPLSGVTLTIMRIGNLKQSETGQTSKSGDYIFKSLSLATYQLELSMVGYSGRLLDPVTINGRYPVDSISVVLISAAASQLSSVTVTGRKALLEKKSDRTVVNVDAMLTSAGADALRMLENVPGVSVDEDGNISLNGKPGVMVMIDNKPTYLSGDALANYLRSIPSSSLEKIELMPTPPAGYDAAGTAGVINFRTKRNLKKGMNGTLSTAFNQGKLFSTTNSLNTNYLTGKVYAYANLGYVTQNRSTGLDIERNYHNEQGQPTYNFWQNSYIRRRNQSYSIRGGMDYQLDQTTSLGYGFSYLHRPSLQTTNNTSKLSQANGTLDSTALAKNREEDKWNNYSVNLNYRKSFKATGTGIAADADYLNYKSRVDQLFTNTTIKPGAPEPEGEELVGYLPSNIEIMAGKMDYTGKLWNWNMEAGLKSSVANTRNTADFTTIKDGLTSPDFEKNNDFRYRENIHAAYISLNGDGKRFSWKAGLRGEQTRSRGHQLGNPVKPDSAFSRSYTNFFPSLFLSYKADSLEKHIITLSYGRRIERPFYQDLNPYVTPLDKFTLYVGNPFLQPGVTNELSVSYTLHKNYVATLSYAMTDEVFMESIVLSGSNYVSRTDNLGTNRLLGFSFNAGIKPAKWWSANIFAEVQDRHYEGRLRVGRLDTSAVYAGTNITNQFQLGKGWSAELGGTARTGILVGQVSLASFWQVNAGVQKKLFGNKATVRLTLRDIFYSGTRRGQIHNLYQADAKFRNRSDLRVGTLSFTWNFGSAQQSRRNRSGGSAEEEQGRVR
ncbi:outer membrane beta-barrel protein [Flavihumibacter stibioxidans]|uniref:TonB-dependent receptor n=1 Tax=Flavihumibacter stibioxidans TaxID=1834163 RepID=A0ABR7M4C5_9BACT|nr:TonB-dependent receptor [Flavihumibacter stibioxidans]MBC6489874.1 hypothetical protein [Flavihumibacter stibioxidans]